MNNGSNGAKLTDIQQAVLQLAEEKAKALSAQADYLQGQAEQLMERAEGLRDAASQARTEAKALVDKDVAATDRSGKPVAQSA